MIRSEISGGRPSETNAEVGAERQERSPDKLENLGEGLLDAASRLEGAASEDGAEDVYDDEPLTRSDFLVGTSPDGKPLYNASAIYQSKGFEDVLARHTQGVSPEASAARELYWRLRRYGAEEMASDVDELNIDSKILAGFRREFLDSLEDGPDDGVSVQEEEIGQDTKAEKTAAEVGMPDITEAQPAKQEGEKPSDLYAERHEGESEREASARKWAIENIHDFIQLASKNKMELGESVADFLERTNGGWGGTEAKPTAEEAAAPETKPNETVGISQEDHEKIQFFHNLRDDEEVNGLWGGTVRHERVIQPSESLKNDMLEAAKKKEEGIDDSSDEAEVPEAIFSMPEAPEVPKVINPASASTMEDIAPTMPTVEMMPKPGKMPAPTMDELVTPSMPEVSVIPTPESMASEETAEIPNPESQAEAAETETETPVVEKPNPTEEVPEAESNETEAEEAEFDPLIAIEMNREYDAKERARELAEMMLTDKIEGDGSKLSKFTRVFRRVVWGNYFREAAKRKYERQALEAISEATAIYDDPSLTDDERKAALADIYIGNSKRKLEASDWSVASRVEMVKYHMVAKESNEVFDEMIHTKAGERFVSYSVRRGEDGNLHAYEHTPDHGEVEVVSPSQQADFAIRMREIVARYAKGEIADRQAFDKEIEDMRMEFPDAYASSNFMTNNYFEIAEKAKERFDSMAESADHEESMERLLRGFAIVNAETRSSVRTETHKNAIDKITDRLSRGKLGRFIPMDVVAGAIGVASAIAIGGEDPNSRGVVQRALRVIPPMSLVAVGAIAGMKEHGRTQEDITRMRRDAARGMDYLKGERNKKLSEAVLKDEEVVNASEYSKDVMDLVGNLYNEAGELNSENVAKLKVKLAFMHFARDISDKNGVDLIRYSGADPELIPRERMNFDIAIASAKDALKKAGVDFSREISDVSDACDALHAFSTNLSEREKVAVKLKRKMARKAGVKSAVTAGLVGLAVQEGTAFVDPTKIGLFERLAGRGDNNVVGADETVLNNLWNRGGRFISTEGSFGDKVGAFLRRTPTPTGEAIDMVTEKQIAGSVSREEALKMVEGNPDRTMTLAGEVGTGEFTETSLGDYVADHSEKIHVSEWLNNGTAKVDLSETQVYFTGQDQWFAQLKNNPFNARMTVDPSAESMNGRLFWFIRTEDVDANNGLGFRIPATLDAATGRIGMDASDDILKKVADGWDFSRIHLGVDMGLDDEGVRNIASIATTFGDGFDGSEIVSRVENTMQVFNVSETVTERIATRATGAAAEAAMRMTAGIPLYAREELANSVAPEVPPISAYELNPESTAPSTPEAPSSETPESSNESDESGDSETPETPETPESEASEPETPEDSESETPETETPPDIPTPGESSEDDETEDDFEVITADSSDTRIPVLSREKLAKRMESGAGVTPPDGEVTRLTEVINRWNSLDDNVRRDLLSGRATNGGDMLGSLLMANLVQLPTDVDDMEMAA